MRHIFLVRSFNKKQCTQLKSKFKLIWAQRLHRGEGAEGTALSFIAVELDIRFTPQRAAALQARGGGL